MRNLALVLGCLIIFANSAMAGTDISAGASVPTPLGDYYSSLKRSVSVTADVTTENFFLKNDTDLSFSALYQPYTLRNAINNKISLFGAFAGLSVPAKTGLGSTELFMALQAGLVYDWMSYSASGSISNSATSFSMRFQPGFKVPVWKGFFAMVDLPFMAVFGNKPLYVWTGSFSLGWRL